MRANRPTGAFNNLSFFIDPQKIKKKIHINMWFLRLHSPTKNRSFSFRKLGSTFFHTLLAANYDFVLSFFSERQISEIVFNESSKSTENALIE
jgi:hypothetical protein